MTLHYERIQAAPVDAVADALRQISTAGRLRYLAAVIGGDDSYQALEARLGMSESNARQMGHRLRCIGALQISASGSRTRLKLAHNSLAADLVRAIFDVSLCQDEESVESTEPSFADLAKPSQE